MKHAPVAITANEKTLRTYYETGFAFCMYGGARTQFEADAKRLWPSVRAEFLKSWIVEHPGERPWIWWKMDAPERRRCVGVWKNDKLIKCKRCHPFDNPKRNAEINQIAAEGAYPGFLEHVYNLSFGKPSVYFVEADWDCAYEDECDYLARLTLLLPGEREQV